MRGFDRDVLRRVIGDGEEVRPSPQRDQPVPKWRKEFVPFGHRLNFLSPEKQHLQTGTLRILPARHPEKRD